MPVSVKKPISFRNPTKYFSPEKDKTRLTVCSPHTWRSKCSKTDGYEARLYWHYKYTESVNGQTFYYTLTYNEASIPKYFGMNCFDYEDLRDLLTGGFRKMLLRKYGTTFKYFIGAELGDGKGSRGMHNNPHYHVLFFLEPSKDGKFPYIKISPEDFRTLVKNYWQGFDENVDGFRDYKSAKYGIAKEGDNCGLVNNFAACVYCAKYVVKDVALKCHETKVRHCLRLKLEESIKTEAFYKDFFESVIFDKFNVPLNPSRTSWSMTAPELLLFHFPDRYDWSVLLYGSPSALCNFYEGAVKDFVSSFHLDKDFLDFYNQRLDELVENGVNEYRNRYCNKCRISHGVGDYAIEDILSRDVPSIAVPTKRDGLKYRPLPLYYYRKLFTEVITPLDSSCKVHCKPSKMSPIRILNEDGLNYRLSRLKDNISKKSEDARTNLELVLSSPSLWEKMYNSDVNTDCFLSHSQLISLCNKLYESKQDFFLDYAIFKLVYEGRYFSVESSHGVDVYSRPRLDLLSDYARFIIPSYYSVSRSDIRLDSFLKGSNPSVLPYSSHPYFHKMLGIFTVLDLCSDYFSIKADDKLEEDAKERSRVKRFFDSARLKEYYSHFK